MGTIQNISRRQFLKASAFIAGGLVIAFTIPHAKRFMSKDSPAATDSAQSFTPNAFLHIDSDDTVTVLLAHCEMGQGIWTTLPMLIAEELDVDLNRIRIEHAPPAPVYAHTAYGLQITGGSTTTWSEFDRYRQAGAMARTLLVTAAAQRLGVDPSQCRTENGVVIVGDQRLTYGELADDAAKLEAPAEVQLRDPSQWKLIGKATKRLDSREKVNGSAIFGQDIHFEGLKVAVVARSQYFGGKVKSYDDSAAKEIPGVIKVIQVPTGVAVVAENFWAAKRGRDALDIEWDAGPNAGLDSEQMFADFRRMAAGRGAVAAAAGEPEAAFDKASKVITAEYTVPYLAHAPMEPLNCTVKIDGDSCEIWTGTQAPGLEQAAAAAILGLKPEQVKVHTPFLGGGFGRRGNPDTDFVSEAVHVAKAAGLPVKTIWTREDDIKGAYYRPMNLHQVKVGLDENGNPLAWHHTCVGQSIMTGTPFEQYMIKDGVDATSVEGLADSPYLKATPNHLVDLHTPKIDIPVLWWRSVGHSQNAFIVESLIDEMAHAAGRDPLEYRRQLLKDHPRHLAALNLAAEKAGWGSPLPSGVFRGIAVHESFGSYVAEVAEVSVNDGEVRVHRVVCAIDCGLVVNPESLVAQMESGIVFGLSAALAGKVSLKDGKIEQSNFHDYPVLRMNQMPKVEVHIVPSTDKMGGAGEPATPPIAPAVTNAIFAATGKRIRTLPIGDQLA
ncbi:MAG TPA: xanthine dehydrogenase family protein molybdopterin-binding subunit [Methylophilaceae bacterium]